MIESFQQMCDAWSALEKAQTELMRAQAGINAFQGKLADLTLLPRLYGWYREAAEQNLFRSDIRNGNHKQFVFVALMLYSPRSLCGDKISNTLRKEIASLLRLRSHTIIYHMRDKAVAWNRTYRPFALEVESAYREIAARLRGQGLME